MFDTLILFLNHAACVNEDDENDLKTRNHNGVILCLLDEELGDRPASPTDSSLHSHSSTQRVDTARLSSSQQTQQLCSKDQAKAEKEKAKQKQIEEEEELKRKYDEISQQKFDQIFRSGLLGLVIESLEMDSWFAGSKSNKSKAAVNNAPAAATELSSTTDPNPQAAFATLAANTV